MWWNFNQIYLQIRFKVVFKYEFLKYIFCIICENENYNEGQSIIKQSYFPFKSFFSINLIPFFLLTMYLKGKVYNWYVT